LRSGVRGGLSKRTARGSPKITSLYVRMLERKASERKKKAGEKSSFSKRLSKIFGSAQSADTNGSKKSQEENAPKKKRVDDEKRLLEEKKKKRHKN